MMKITIALLFISFNVLSCMKMSKKKLSQVEDFITKTKKNGDYYTIEEVASLSDFNVAFNFCKEKYPGEHCYDLIEKYIKPIVTEKLSR